MAKLSWNNYIEKYTNNTIGFAAPVSSRLPSRLVFDKNGRKLPTPYALFVEWCSAYLTGDWAVTKVPKGLILCVAGESDAKAIQAEFKIIGPAKITKASKRTYPIGYKDSEYGALAGDLGYVF